MPVVIVSLDGIGTSDLNNLRELLPEASKTLDFERQIPFKGSHFTSAQAIWAEILTGQPWYHSGVCGFSRPVRSLNRLTIVGEQDLRAPISFASRESRQSPTVSINVPIIRPKPACRYWLSDGSMSINQYVSPAALADVSDHCRQYNPREFSNSAQLIMHRRSIETLLAVETNRLECAIDIMTEQKWDRAICRFNVFDYLSHILGPDRLVLSGMSLEKAALHFFARLDDFLSKLLCKANIELVLLSAYSHRPCTALLNLNELLMQGGFLKFDQPDSESRASSLRREATECVAHVLVHEVLLGSNEGRIDLSGTVAASPVAGAIFINTKRRFEDGIVEESDCERVLSEVEQFLKQELIKRFGNFARIIRRTGLSQPAKNDSDQSIPLPDLVVAIEGVEFIDVPSLARKPQDLPFTTHSEIGFLIASENALNRKTQTMRCLDLLGAIDDF